MLMLIPAGRYHQSYDKIAQVRSWEILWLLEKDVGEIVVNSGGGDEDAVVSLEWNGAR